MNFTTLLRIFNFAERIALQKSLTMAITAGNSRGLSFGNYCL